MSRPERKAKRILAEILGYFIDQGLTDMAIHWEPTPDGVRIEVQGHAPERPPDFEEFRRALSDAAQPEMEEYYLQLLDMASGKEHRYLLGAMVDEADVTYEDGILRVSVFRKD
ncbi:MAG: hypothetical protein KBA30_04110 [Clostridia bacterium]|nr:hypothetical protein [Clostridia bacterium]